MIITALLNLIYTLLSVLLVFELPKLPNEVLEYFNTFFDYLTAGAGILANYTPLTYLLVLLGIVVAIDVGINIYHFVMWILKKIPFLGMQ